MTSETKLLPCPFCGGEAAATLHWNLNGGCAPAFDCQKCGASLIGDGEAWNTRHERTTRIVQGSEGTPFGENIVIPLVCEVCGHGISVKDNYCRTCGARIEEAADAD